MNEIKMENLKLTQEWDKTFPKGYVNNIRSCLKKT